MATRILHQYTISLTIKVDINGRYELKQVCRSFAIKFNWHVIVLFLNSQAPNP